MTRQLAARTSYERIETKTPSPSSHAGTAKRTARAISLASAVVISALYLGLTPAEALTCKQVRQWVASYGENLVIAYAKANGYSDKKIEHAKRCLK